ncbi:helix-turn-helix domain-containing protein [Stenotrophomonas sp. 24(2023)]|uniref:winged helix-turn-helix transcriptional regulator n=1 Tax=Stenotrophomonas sp. 24(2023) TaxID=3068324 RepID=UPI0027E13A4F|nr:helix-turn-helix domain-containing protein [Stenotrophomonas sp. 24(2023)]WMJ68240.1 helix-turn-helix domain-containing protein [Stenotrophomonas sp. 24(2023)]
MSATSTHFQVPGHERQRGACLGPDGSAAQVHRVIAMIEGRWKLPILFRLFEHGSVRMLQLKRDMPGVSQKMLTQHLRELEADGLVHRREIQGRVRHVDYALSAAGHALLPAFRALRHFADQHPADNPPQATGAP